MRIQGKHYRTIWYERGIIYIIDQPKLPHSFEIVALTHHNEVYRAIKDMTIRGAPAIGAAGCFGLAQALRNYDDSEDFGHYVDECALFLKSARPTAYDLTHGIDHIVRTVRDTLYKEKSVNKNLIAHLQQSAEREAQKYADDSAAACKMIGKYGSELIRDGMSILTHCNAGALATVDFGTALAPLRIAHEQGKHIHVFVDETRPRCQGSRLTAFELAEEGIPHHIIADNAAGYYMRKKEIQLVITGSDRVALNGDAANKIGTYEKAVCARENNIPFYIAVPFSSIDFQCATGDDIPIEERSPEEVLYAHGWSDSGRFERVRISPEKSPAHNPAFDVTPASYITGIITEKGLCTPEDLRFMVGS